MQGWKTQLRSWIRTGMMGAGIGMFLLLYLAGGVFRGSVTWIGMGVGAMILVLPCVATSMLGVCVSRKVLRREILLIPPLIFIVPSFFMAELGFDPFVLCLLAAGAAVWGSGLVGISIAAKSDAELTKPKEDRTPVVSE